MRGEQGEGCPQPEATVFRASPTSRLMAQFIDGKNRAEADRQQLHEALIKTVDSQTIAVMAWSELSRENADLRDRLARRDEDAASRAVEFSLMEQRAIAAEKHLSIAKHAAEAWEEGYGKECREVARLTKLCDYLQQRSEKVPQVMDK